MEYCMEKIVDVEKKAAGVADLLEVAKGYCDYNLGKCKELSSVGTMLEYILKTQRELVKTLDSFD